MGVLIKSIMSLMKSPPKDTNLCCKFSYYFVWGLMGIIAFGMVLAAFNS